MEKIIDLSHVIEDEMPVYPGDIRTNLFQTKYLSVNKHNNHRVEICMHSGTHIDGPMHLTEDNTYISDIPLDSFIGRGCVLDVRNEDTICMKPQYENIVEEGSMVLLYTGFDKNYGSLDYYHKHPVVDAELCRFLLSRNIKILGMDTPSPDRYPFEIHKMLFRGGAFIIENLTNLDKLLNEERFEVIALPLKLKADSSILRVVARIL
jgi:kynurenine formamidase